ncbi:MAG: 23S rRNA pseudouridine(2604) synthase [Paracidovorax wautersii]|uniref:Dual-specificity RNA pseudouridine synthase RluF n=1 Tax=Paracidovorax wautersii TaxID=1177982 RepID=A0A7V8JQM8_9BURK|nr:MAG: 23S rRNA pseudouridine(2604) synthase [Paracidovorax wautersii]
MAAIVGRRPLAAPLRAGAFVVRVYRAPEPGSAAARPPVTPRAVAAPARTGTAAPAPAPADSGLVRLNKRMADLGLCSRREADDWIAQGWVRVNGEVAGMGVKVGAADAITVDREARGQQARQVTILLHKPMGYVSGQAEDGHQPAVTLIRPETHWRGDTSAHRFQGSQLRGLAPAGRLDIDSVGLLVLTQDGRVARRLIGEDSSIDKEYLVRVQYGAVVQDVQAVFPTAALARLRHGLALDGQALKPAEVDWQNPEQLRFVLREGKKRQIRRMCELVGLKVVGLKRIRMGRVVLGQLPPGQWRYLGESESF